MNALLYCLPSMIVGLQYFEAIFTLSNSVISHRQIQANVHHFSATFTPSPIFLVLNMTLNRVQEWSYNTSLYPVTRLHTKAF